MKNAIPGDSPPNGMNVVVRALKVIGLMALGGVLTLAGLFLSGAVLVWRTDHLPTLADFETTGDGESVPSRLRMRPSSRVIYNASYIPMVEPADPAFHMAARDVLAAGGIPGAADTIALAGHRVVQGDGAVIAYQHAWGLDEPDQYPPEAGFEKFTMYLAAPLEGESGSFELGDESGAFAFWSTGTANPPWDNACIAYAMDGHVDYRRKGKEMELDLSLEMQSVHAGTGQAAGCDRVRIQQHVAAWIGQVEYLNAWRGAGWGRVTIHEAVRERHF